MEKPKKEKKFLKSIGRISGVLAQELVLGLGRKYIGKMINKIKIPKKRETLSFFLLLSCTFAFAQYPATGNKQRLGYQTTGDGLVWRGSANDTVSLKSSTINNAYIIIDTVNNVMYNYIKTKGGWLFNNADTVIINNNFTQPVDSLFFKTSVSTNNVDTAKMRWDYELGTVVLGMYDKVPNELGFKNFWLVKNQTGSTITKNSLVYASGTVGASGRISVSKFIANGTIDAKYLLGITAHDLTDGEDGYVISYGKIRQVNTDTFAAGAILYPSPTTAGVWTDVEPVAPNIDLPIGFCVNSSSNNGTIAIRVASGFSLSELHDVAISSPSANASLYYSSGLWRDTTSALLVSDTSSMLTNYLRTGVAALTYLPLTGGTLTGGLTGTTANFVGNFGIGTNTPLNLFEVSKSNNGTSTSLRITNSFSETGSTDETADIDFYQGSSGGYFTSGRVRSFREGDYFTANTQITGGLSFWTQTSNAIPANGFTEKMRITSTGNVGIGTTSPQSTLEIHGSAVFNEGSGDYDTRIESDGNANMVFVDASTDRVGIGTNTPSKTLDVNGEVKIVTTSVTPTVLLGKDANNVLGQLYIDGGLSIIGSNLYGIKPYYTSDNSTSQTFASNFMNTVSSAYLKINQNSTVTITLPSATNNGGKSFTIKNLGTGAVNSNSSNVEPQNSTTLGTAILGSGGSKWATLVSDGTNWVIMQSN